MNLAVSTPRRIIALTYSCCVGQGVLGHTLNPVRQVFERIPSSSAAADAEARFQHFKKRVWLRIKESGASGLCSFPCCFFTTLTLGNRVFFPVGGRGVGKGDVLSYQASKPLRTPETVRERPPPPPLPSPPLPCQVT